MVLAILCAFSATYMLLSWKRADMNNRNGASVSILQKILFRISVFIARHPIIAHMTFSYIPPDIDMVTRQGRIEKTVWLRLLVASSLVGLSEAVIRLCSQFTMIVILNAVITYILILQFTLLLSLLRPLFGVSIDAKLQTMKSDVALKRTPYIPAPRRSLLMALVNFFEILLSWAVIYRFLAPGAVKSMDQANYFSVVTLTTVGYGDINAGDCRKMQIAITANLIVFVVFSICHITTVLGSMSSSEDFKD